MIAFLGLFRRSTSLLTFAHMVLAPSIFAQNYVVERHLCTKVSIGYTYHVLRKQAIDSLQHCRLPMSKGKACPEEIARHIHPSMSPVSCCSLTGWQGMAPDGQHKNACGKYKSSKTSSRSVWYMVAPLSPMKIIGLMLCAAYCLNMAALLSLQDKKQSRLTPG